MLDRLVEHGLVLAEPTNRGYMYRLNRDHLLMPAVLAAASVRHQLLDRLTSAVQALTPRPVHASVYGSFARGDGDGDGDEDEDSDFDLFLLMDAGFTPEPNWESQMRQLEDDVHAWTGNRLEMVTMDQESFSSAIQNRERIVEELGSDAIAILGPDIDSLTSSGIHQGTHK